MIKLNTPVAVEPSALKLDHRHPVLLVGSCFTEHIGARLEDYGFRVMMNPFGILYNPLSIAEALRRCQENDPISEADLVEHNGLWHSWLHHGCFSNRDREACLDLCNQRIEEAHRLLQEPCTILVTLGSAYAYFLKGRDKVPVANCHKLPAAHFEKRLLSVREIAEAFESLNIPNARFIYTISPIRHWADGAHGNQVSKSTLMLAVETLRCVSEKHNIDLTEDTRCADFRTSSASYFPSYEIVMDELRDYRFYAEDMLHPSPLAVEIIWQRFCETYLTQETITLGERFHQLHAMEAHRPLFPESEAYRRHLEKTEALRNELRRLTNTI